MTINEFKEWLKNLIQYNKDQFNDNTVINKQIDIIFEFLNSSKGHTSYRLSEMRKALAEINTEINKTNNQSLPRPTLSPSIGVMYEKLEEKKSNSEFLEELKKLHPIIKKETSIKIEEVKTHVIDENNKNNEIKEMETRVSDKNNTNNEINLIINSINIKTDENEKIDTVIGEFKLLLNNLRDNLINRRDNPREQHENEKFKFITTSINNIISMINNIINIFDQKENPLPKVQISLLKIFDQNNIQIDEESKLAIYNKYRELSEIHKKYKQPPIIEKSTSNEKYIDEFSHSQSTIKTNSKTLAGFIQNNKEKILKNTKHNSSQQNARIFNEIDTMGDYFKNTVDPFVPALFYAVKNNKLETWHQCLMWHVMNELFDENGNIKSEISETLNDVFNEFKNQPDDEMKKQILFGSYLLCLSGIIVSHQLYAETYNDYFTGETLIDFRVLKNLKEYILENLPLKNSDSDIIKNVDTIDLLVTLNRFLMTAGNGAVTVLDLIGQFKNNELFGMKKEDFENNIEELFEKGRLQVEKDSVKKTDDEIDNFDIMEISPNAIDEKNFESKKRLKSKDVYRANVGIFEQKVLREEMTLERIILDGNMERGRVYKDKDTLNIIYYPGKDNNIVVEGDDTPSLEDVIHIVDQETKDYENNFIKTKKYFTICESNKYLGTNVAHFVYGTVDKEGFLTIRDSIDRNYDTTPIEAIIPNAGTKVIKLGYQSALNNWECGYHVIDETAHDVNNKSTHQKRSIDNKLIDEQSSYYEMGIVPKNDLLKQEYIEKTKPIDYKKLLINLEALIRYVENIRGSLPTGLKKIQKILLSNNFTPQDLLDIQAIATQRLAIQSTSRLRETTHVYKAITDITINKVNNNIENKVEYILSTKDEHSILNADDAEDALCQKAYFISKKERRALEQLFKKIEKIVAHIKASTVFTPTGVKKIEAILKLVKKDGANKGYLLDMCIAANERLTTSTSRSPQTREFYAELQALGKNQFPEFCRDWEIKEKKQVEIIEENIVENEIKIEEIDTKNNVEQKNPLGQKKKLDVSSLGGSQYSNNFLPCTVELKTISEQIIESNETESKKTHQHKISNKSRLYLYKDKNLYSDNENNIYYRVYYRIKGSDKNQYLNYRNSISLANENFTNNKAIDAILEQTSKRGHTNPPDSDKYPYSNRYGLFKPSEIEGDSDFTKEFPILSSANPVAELQKRTVTEIQNELDNRTVFQSIAALLK